LADRISTLDQSYQTGDLSLFPVAIDNRSTLYEATNNAETTLVQSLSFLGKFLVVEDASRFPDEGLIRVDDELIYYGSKNTNILRDLKRGFALSRQGQHLIGTKVTCSVMAEHHNAIKDAIINIQKNIGIKVNPDPESLNGILTDLEFSLLAPKPKFRAFPLLGAPPLKVRFQNFSGGPPIRFLWDFGDGTTSVEVHPQHTYQKEGIYTVKVSMITSLGAQGIVTKKDYIKVDKNEKLPLFYAETITGTSKQTAGNAATVFKLVDQTDGDIISRYWIWDDNQNDLVEDPDIHTATHIYDEPGEYEPVLLAVFSDGKLKRVAFEDKLIVT
jgi:PKD repeat protein